ncbi:MAG: riboflavin synthase [Candidatus Omnitrophica bacterium]|nr:riboflavin synthase [Candidatus Omnitrophota bacterium]
MFTGIIEELGRVSDISKRGNVSFLTVETGIVWQDSRIGDSIAVNGVCLTVVKIDKGRLSFEVMPQTMKNTCLCGLRISEAVNLERSLKVGERLSGHFVLGHIDCVGLIRRKSYVENNLCFAIAIPVEQTRYVLPKGSIAIDGISLTVVSRRSNLVSVYVIPHTLKNTTLNIKGPSDKVNIELDILAKKADVLS